MFQKLDYTPWSCIDTCFSPVLFSVEVFQDIALLKAYHQMHLNPAFNFARYLRWSSLHNLHPLQSLDDYRFFWRAPGREHIGRIFLDHYLSTKNYLNNG